MSKLVQNIILITLLFVSLSSINQWTTLPIQNVTLWWLFYALIIYLALKGKANYYNDTNDSNFYFIKIFLIWNSICIVRGLFVAEDYWEWKHLIGTAMILLLPLVAYIGSNTYYVQKLVSKWIKFILPLFLLIALFTERGAYGRFLIPVSFVLLFYPILNTRWKIMSVTIAIFVILIDLGARSNVIKFIAPFAIGLVYYFKSNILVQRYIGSVRIVLLVTPVILLVLGITGIFNVFKMNDYIDGDYSIESKGKGSGNSESLTADTRTFIYDEVITSAVKHDYVLLGRTPARGNESPYFGPSIDKELNRNKNERFANEVGIANIFTWTGLIGVLLYFLIFIKASYLALKKSNNWFIKLMGIYISFRWLYAWVEDYSRFDLSTIFLWILIAMCISKEFRELSDHEFKNWCRGIFDQRYRDAILKKQLVGLNKE